jgi:isopenicillin-N N-acyltransferase like protein
MKNKIYLLTRFATLTILILSCFLFTQCKIYKSYHDILAFHHNAQVDFEKGKPRLEYLQSIPIVHLYGSPHEIGQQYGHLLKNQLHSLVSLSEGIFSRKKIEEFIKLGKDASHNLTEDMVNELKGISDASGVDYSVLLALNLAPKITCSTFAVWEGATSNGELIMGRNADYPFKKVNKALGLIVVKHPEKGYATVTITFLGMIGGFSGMNETGLSYGNMLAYNDSTEKFNTNGLSVQLLLQAGGQSCSTAREMIEFLSKQQQITPNNVMCADKKEALLIECSYVKNEIREGQKGVLAATNYFLSPGLYNQYEPCERFENLMNHAKLNYGKYTVPKVQEAMQLARRKGKNLQCVIFEPSTKTMHVSINKEPASKGPFIPLKIEDLLKK